MTTPLLNNQLVTIGFIYNCDNKYLFKHYGEKVVFIDNQSREVTVEKGTLDNGIVQELKLSNQNKGIDNVNRCCVCGEIIPEGIQVCKSHYRKED